MNKVLCINFDGVIHSYTSGWQGPGVISDPPVEGAFEALRQYMKKYDVCILSVRNGYPEGIVAMKQWFKKHGWPQDILGNPQGIEFALKKPDKTHLIIDDRAYTFRGKWPTLKEVDEFTPWNWSLRHPE
jgi:hypothetical protein